MRNRGHTCDMCMHIDEHHYKRHHDMCKLIRSIYESCGEEWPIVPEDEDDRGRSRTRGSDAFESDSRSSTSGEVPLKKRDKKEQKRQIRAASRTKVITQEDIKYIDSVLHPAASQAGTENPNNPEEIEEIEQHLRYNAQCYNEGQKRSDIRQFAHIPDADIDFGAEMDRIFEILRISELLKRNEGNRGLRNKELANFRTLVSDVKDQIITDLVQAKRDELEIRMRRAAFLRYTNRASFEVVANRYADKDWKTGEKYRSTGSGSASSDGLTAVEEEELQEDDLVDQSQLRNMSAATLNDADRRHVEYAHKKIGSNGRLEEIVAVREIKDTLKENTPKPPPSLRIINTNIVPPRQLKFRNPWKQRNGLVPDSDDEWQTVGFDTGPVLSPSGHSRMHLASADRAPFLRGGGRMTMAETRSLNTGPPRRPSAMGPSMLEPRADDRCSTNGPIAGDPAQSPPSATPKARSSGLKPTRVGVIVRMYQNEAERHQMAEKVQRDAAQAYVQRL